MSNNTRARRALVAGTALVLAFGLGGCSTIQSIFGGNNAQRDETTNEVVEEGTGSAFELNPGDCFDIPTDEQFSDVKLIPCADPHDAEVIINYDAAGDTYDAAAIEEEAMTRCAAEFTTYVGISPEESSEHWYNFFTPVASGWKTGDKEVTCIVHKLDENNNVVKSTGTAKGLAQ